MEDNLFLMFCIAIGALIISILILRSVFSVDRHLKNQKATIQLLIKLCRQQGVKEDELDEIKKQFT